jgi:hypothetical protein
MQKVVGSSPISRFGLTLQIAGLFVRRARRDRQFAGNQLVTDSPTPIGRSTGTDTFHASERLSRWRSNRRLSAFTETVAGSATSYSNPAGSPPGEEYDRDRPLGRRVRALLFVPSGSRP